MSIRYDIGDLVYLDDVNITGVIIDKIVFGNELVDGLVDVEVQWTNGTNYWCLAEGLTIVSKANVKKNL
jgi:hypothetical protein